MHVQCVALRVHMNRCTLTVRAEHSTYTPIHVRCVQRVQNKCFFCFCFCFYNQACSLLYQTQIISIPWNPPSFIFRALVIAAITIEISKWSKIGKGKDQFAWFVGWLFISWHTGLATGTYTLAGCCNNILRADVSCPHSKSRPWLSLRDLTRIKKQKNAVMTSKRKNTHRLSSRVKIRVESLTVISGQIVRNLHCKLMNTSKNVLSLYDLFTCMCLCIFSW